VLAETPPRARVAFPGFTAAASLYRSRNHYQTVAARPGAASAMLAPSETGPAHHGPVLKANGGNGGNGGNGFHPPKCTVTCGECSDCFAECTVTCVPGGTTTFRSSCCGLGNFTCVDNGCVCPPPNTFCAPDVCTDLTTDRGNCGTCGNQCWPGQICNAGVCCSPSQVCFDKCCPDGTYCSEGMCCPVGTFGCGNQSCCPAGQCCDGGQCTCNGICCAGNETCCNGVCADTSADAGNCGSCGHICAPGLACEQGQCVPAAACPAPVPLTSFTNLILADSDCGNIGDLAISVRVTEELVTGNNFSIQLNTYAPPGLAVNAMQYLIDFARYPLSISGAPVSVSGNYQGWTCDPGCSETFGTPSWNWSWSDFGFVLEPAAYVGSVPTSTIPAGTVFGISLTTSPGATAEVNAVTFEMTGFPSVTVPLPASQQFPVSGFQVDIVGEFNSALAIFASGGGEIEYSVPTGTLCSLTTPGLPCSSANPNFGIHTTETSNIVYSPIAPCCGETISQAFAG
jgi:hypothetical protein